VVAGSHRILKMKRLRLRRMALVVVIQSQVRRRQATAAVQRRRLLYHKTATVIQRYYRGYACRLLLLLNAAARIIQRFMRRLVAINFRDAVSWWMEVRRQERRKQRAAEVVTGAVRMRLAKKELERRRVVRAKRFIAVYRIARAFRKHRLAMIMKLKVGGAGGALVRWNFSISATEPIWCSGDALIS